MFGFGMHKEVTLAMFKNAPYRDQNLILQELYDKGYSGKEIAKFFELSESTVYSRITARRGRGSAQTA